MNLFLNIKFFSLSAVILSVMLFSACKDQSTSVNDDLDPDAPTVITTSPANNDAEVARNVVIEITFNEEMDPATINSSTLTVNQESSAISGSVASSGNTATFTADNALDALSDHTVTVTTGAKSATGTALAADMVWSFTTGGSTTPLDVVDLGTAGNFVVLAKTAVNNSPTSAFTGDLGLSPAAETFYTGFSQTAATGFSTSSQVTGRLFAADMTDPTPANLTTAVNDMVTAYNDAAGRPTPDFVGLYTGNLGGKTLSPGLYKWDNTVLIPEDVTISGGADDVWIFQIAEDLTVSSAATIILTDGAQAKNIFWQVAGEATIGTTAHFEGVLLSMTGITLNTGATFNGRILAQTAAIFDGNTVVEPAL
ncbi:MAG: ice-binding family protein [Balneolaceae bacterium]